MLAKELANGFSDQTTFYELTKKHNDEFIKAFKRNNGEIAKLEPDQLANLRASQKIYFSTLNTVTMMITPEHAGSHAMCMIGLVGKRIVFFYTVRAPCFFMCMH